MMTEYEQTLEELEKASSGTGEAALIYGIRALVLATLCVAERVDAIATIMESR